MSKYDYISPSMKQYKQVVTEVYEALPTMPESVRPIMRTMATELNLLNILGTAFNAVKPANRIRNTIARKAMVKARTLVDERVDKLYDALEESGYGN
jgi:uncharacterized protein (UPF0297 family)